MRALPGLLLVSLGLPAWLGSGCGCQSSALSGALDAGTGPLQVGPASVTRLKAEPGARLSPTAALAVCEAKGQLPLEAARAYFDAQQFEQALSCAAQASALTPADVLAHTERGNALAGLERFDEAKLAYARALAIDPDSLEGLVGAAHLYAVQLPSTREVDELGALYAEHGFELAQGQRDEEFSRSFARIAAMALNDLGEPREALARAQWVLERQPDDPEASYERAVALFELCQFEEAAPAFEKLLGDPERAPFAHEHLGLLLEREGRQHDADSHFRRATELAPEDFPAPVLVSPAEFRAELDQTLEGLPADMSRDLEGVAIEVEDLPREHDLVANDPPLSPTILGLFRGPPLGEACEPAPDSAPGAPCRSVVVYRKNLSRAVKSRPELVEQIKVTLLHEIGHLRGEDDGELAARGLE